MLDERKIHGNLEKRMQLFVFGHVFIQYQKTIHNTLSLFVGVSFSYTNLFETLKRTLVWIQTQLLKIGGTFAIEHGI